jgi:hypothetical protein
VNSDKSIFEWTKADFDAAFGPGKCLHRYGKNMLPAEDGRFRCPDCGETFDVPPTAEDIERLINDQT